MAKHTTLVVVDAYNAEEAVQMRRFARGRLQPLASRSTSDPDQREREVAFISVQTSTHSAAHPLAG